MQIRMLYVLSINICLRSLFKICLCMKSFFKKRKNITGKIEALILFPPFQQ